MSINMLGRLQFISTIAAYKFATPEAVIEVFNSTHVLLHYISKVNSKGIK